MSNENNAGDDLMASQFVHKEEKRCVGPEKGSEQPMDRAGNALCGSGEKLKHIVFELIRR